MYGNQAIYLEGYQTFNNDFKEKEEVRAHPKREEFFRDLSERKSVAKAVERASHVSVLRKRKQAYPWK